MLTAGGRLIPAQDLLESLDPVRQYLPEIFGPNVRCFINPQWIWSEKLMLQTWKFHNRVVFEELFKRVQFININFCRMCVPVLEGGDIWTDFDVMLRGGYRQGTKIGVRCTAAAVDPRPAPSDLARFRELEKNLAEALERQVSIMPLGIVVVEKVFGLMDNYLVDRSSPIFSLLRPSAR